MRRVSIPPRLRAWYHRHTVDALIGATAAVVVLALGVGYLLQRHPTRESAMLHVAEQARIANYDVEKLQKLQLSEAEIAALNAKPHFDPHWETAETDSATKRVTVEGPDRPVTVRVPYDDGFISVSDVVYRVTDRDADPIEQASATGAVVAGGPGEAMLSACCGGGEAPVTVALRSDPPGVPAAGWAEASEVDLDLRTGRLAFSAVGGTVAVVSVPPGRYRLRASGKGAVEFEQDEERFLVELWPRTRDTGPRVLRRAT